MRRAVRNPAAAAAAKKIQTTRGPAQRQVAQIRLSSTTASGRYIRCSATVCEATGRKLEVGASRQKKHAPRNPATGRRNSATMVVMIGEFGRTPKLTHASGCMGRDHWPQCGFTLLFGGGVKRGVVVGKSDKLGVWPADRPVSAGDMVATIYHLLGVNTELTVPDIDGRPVHICHGGSPVMEAIL